jgi:DNA replication protein
MKSFTGFSEGRSRPTPIPAEFFGQLLPQIDSLDELRVTLYVLWYLERQETSFMQFRASEIADDPDLKQGFLNSDRNPSDRLNDALGLAVARGTILKWDDGQQEPVFFLNSPRGQAGLKACQAGKLDEIPANLPPQVGKEKPNIFRLYEENIGPLTPLIAEDLRSAEAEYPAAWIDEAFHLAVQRNARSWRYISAVLKRWKEEGRNGTNQRGDRQDRQGYAEWENG